MDILFTHFDYGACIILVDAHLDDIMHIIEICLGE
jgi:hypothetical protein